jgi:hypothetical protein
VTVKSSLPSVLAAVKDHLMAQIGGEFAVFPGHGRRTKLQAARQEAQGFGDPGAAAQMLRKGCGGQAAGQGRVEGAAEIFKGRFGAGLEEVSVAQGRTGSRDKRTTGRRKRMI